ncbi:hypothetical protein I8H89_03430 [Candidatus Saccharibacteria bacterium]|nr:hypothetical protein [Candidatus Saccharibacteria bacterium]
MPSPQEHQQNLSLEANDKPRVSGPGGNRKIFDRDNNIGYTIGFNPTKPGGSVFVLRGPDQFGAMLEYSMQGGRYQIKDSAGSIQGGVVGDGFERQRATLGDEYGLIQSVDFVGVLSEDVEHHDSMREMYVQELDHIERSRRQARIGGAGVRVAQEYYENQRLKKYERSEFFNANDAVTLQFIAPDSFAPFRVRLTGIDNFVAPTRESSINTSASPALTQYQLRENRHAHKLPSYKVDEKYARTHDMNREALTLIDQFTQHDSRGKAAMKTLGLHSGDLANISPRQAIDLVGHMMYELTQYDYAATNGNPNKADAMNSLDLLREGMWRDSKQSVAPLGVCRNYSTATKMLFDALKSQNSHLKNVHCFNMAGYTRDTTGVIGDRSAGHAWVDFVMQTSGDEIVATTVDPTWVEKSIDGRLQRYGQIERRIGTHYKMFAGMKEANGWDTPNNSRFKDRNKDAIEGYYRSQITKCVSDLHERYGNGKKLLTENIPLDDHMFEKASHMVFELAIFSSSNNRPSLTRGDKLLLLRATERQDMSMSSEDVLVALDVLSDIAVQRDMSVQQHERAKAGLLRLSSRMRASGTDIEALVRKQTAGLGVGSIRLGERVRRITGE